MSQIKQQKKDKTEKIAKTISSNFLQRGYEELVKTIWWWTKKISTKTQNLTTNQITPELDRYENILIKTRIIHH